MSILGALDLLGCEFQYLLLTSLDDGAELVSEQGVGPSGGSTERNLFICRLRRTADAALFPLQFFGLSWRHVENDGEIFGDVLSSKGDFGEKPERSPVYRQVRSSGADVENSDSHFPFVHRQQRRPHRYCFKDEPGDVDSGLGNRMPQRRADVRRSCCAERFHFQAAAVEPERILHRFAVEGVALYEPVQNRRASGRRGGFFCGRKGSLDIVFVDGVGASGNGNGTPMGVCFNFLAGHPDVGTDDLETGPSVRPREPPCE